MARKKGEPAPGLASALVDAAERERVAAQPSLSDVVAAADRVKATLEELNRALLTAAHVGINVSITREPNTYEYGDGWKPGTPPKQKPVKFLLKRLDFELK